MKSILLLVVFFGIFSFGKAQSLKKDQRKNDSIINCTVSIDNLPYQINDADISPEKQTDDLPDQYYEGIFDTIQFDNFIDQEYQDILPITIDHDLIQLPDGNVDASLEEAIIQYQLFNLDHRKRVFKWQFYSSIIIFVIVLIIVFMGLILAYLHFKRSLNSDTELEIGSSGLKIKTSIVGVIILIISIVFFYLYLVHVYEIKEISAITTLISNYLWA